MEKIRAYMDRIRCKLKGFHLSRKTLGRVSYYAALACLLALLGSASYAYRSRGETAEPAPQPAQPVAAAMPIAPEPMPEPVRWAWPLEGETVGEYSPLTPVWSPTLGQWQTHPAIDIAGSPGEAVYACGDGTVADAWQDALWGNVIVVDHGDGFRSTYAGLNTLNLVNIGDAVSAGDVISAVGQSAACEAELSWHLHFAMEKDGEPVDFAAMLAN